MPKGAPGWIDPVTLAWTAAGLPPVAEWLSGGRSKVWRALAAAGVDVERIRAESGRAPARASRLAEFTRAYLQFLVRQTGMEPDPRSKETCLARLGEAKEPWIPAVLALQALLAQKLPLAGRAVPGAFLTGPYRAAHSAVAERHRPQLGALLLCGQEPGLLRFYSLCDEAERAAHPFVLRPPLPITLRGQERSLESQIALCAKGYRVGVYAFQAGRSIAVFLEDAPRKRPAAIVFHDNFRLMRCAGSAPHAMAWAERLATTLAERPCRYVPESAPTPPARVQQFLAELLAGRVDGMRPAEVALRPAFGQSALVLRAPGGEAALAAALAGVAQSGFDVTAGLGLYRLKIEFRAAPGERAHAFRLRLDAAAGGVVVTFAHQATGTAKEQLFAQKLRSYGVLAWPERL